MKTKLIALLMVTLIFVMFFIPIPLIHADEITITEQVVASSDDCWKKVYNSGEVTFSLTVNYVTAGASKTTNPTREYSGIRFQSVNVPKYAYIKSAYIEFCANVDWTQGGVKTAFYGQDSDNANTFSTLSDFNSRPRTTAKIDWDYPELTQWYKDQWYRSPDISSIIQEIVNRNNWQNGNNMVIFWGDDGTEQTALNLKRGAKSYDLSTTQCAKLTITYIDQLIKDPDFDDSSKWSLWKNDWEDIEPTFSSWYSTISNGILTMYVYDEINWDYGDAGASQGRKPHGNGQYFNSPLSQEIIIYPDIPDGKLIGKLKAKYYYTPIKRGGYSNPSRAWTACAGLCYMVFLDLYVECPIGSGNKYWLNYDDTNLWGQPNLGVLEMFNRWAYDLGQWHQVDDFDFRYNFCTSQTTHDSDYHSINAGWIFASANTWQTFTVDFGRIFRVLCAYLALHYSTTVIKAKVRAISVSTECYLAEMKYSVDTVELLY